MCYAYWKVFSEETDTPCLHFQIRIDGLKNLKTSVCFNFCGKYP